MKLQNLIGMGFGSLNYHLSGKRTPLNVMLSLTNRCLSSCQYCRITQRKQTELTTQEVFSLIDQITSMGCKRLGLWGGEPLIREDIIEIVKYAKSKKLFVTMDSNGYLLPEKTEILKNLDHLVLSFDGPQEMHDLNREKGSFHKVMRAIELAHNKIPLWTITVITKNNIEAIDYILHTAIKYGFLTTFQFMHHNDKLGRNHESMMLTNNECRQVIKKLIDEKRKGAPIVSTKKYLNYISNWTDYSKPTSLQKIRNLNCYAGKLYCNVDTDGSVYPCSLLVEKEKTLNFLETGFKKAFDSLNNKNACKACIASCFTEYNYLFSLDPATIYDWLNSLRKTRKK
jgi:MoaA/NifB/PqqE/SkfB family radical SAM enzyme